MRTVARNLAFAWCTVLVVLAGAAWWWSHYDSIGIFALPFESNARVFRGTIYWRHVYEHSASSIPAASWPGSPILKARILPPLATYPTFRFSSGHEMGYVLPSGRIQPAKYRLLLTPVWLFLVLFAVYPVTFLLYTPRRRRRQRLEQGLCVRCGYDLRGNASGQCPECGCEVQLQHRKPTVVLR